MATEKPAQTFYTWTAATFAPHGAAYLIRMNHKKGGPRTCLRPASPQKRIQPIYKPEFASDGSVTILHSIVFLVDAGRAPVGIPLELVSVLLRGTHVNWGIEI